MGIDRGVEDWRSSGGFALDGGVGIGAIGIGAIDIVTIILCPVFGQKTYKVLVREGVMCSYLLTKIIQIKLNPLPHV